MNALRKKIRNLIQEAFIDDKGDLLDFDFLSKYPHKKIGKLIGDFIDANFEDWAKMGWSVFDSDYSDNYNSETGTVWRVERIDNPEDWDVPVLITLKSDEEAYKKAKEAGFILDDNGVILGLWGINMVDSLQEEKKPLKRVAGALIQDQQSGDFFLLKRNDRSPKWAMVTGKIDEDEEPIDALEREMYEELFIRPDGGKIRLNYKGVEAFPAQNMELYYFEGFVNGKKGFNPILDEENIDYGWFSIDTLPSPLIGGLYGKIKEMSKKDMSVSYFEQKPQLNEIRKQIRLIMEQKIMPKYYMQEAVNLIREAEEKSPTYHWDLTNKGIKDEPSPTYHWDLSSDEVPSLNSYDQAKEYIDKALSYIKDKANAIEFIKDLKNYIKDLSFSAKIKLTKYVATALLGLIGLTAITSIMSNSSSEIEREVVRTIVANKEPKKQEVKIGYPTKSSEKLLSHLKDSEGYKSTFYDLGDGAYTVGWGHAVFFSESRGSTGGDYPFVPHFSEITPDVTMLLSKEDIKYLKDNFKNKEERLKKAEEIALVHAEELLKDDIKKAEEKLNRILDNWKEQGIETEIDQDMYDAMISMIFNMGAGEKFRTSEFLQSVKRGDFKNAYAAIEKIDHPRLLKKYKGLRVRRAKEKEMFGKNLDMAKQEPAKLSDISEARIIIRKTINNII